MKYILFNEEHQIRTEVLDPELVCPATGEHLFYDGTEYLVTRVTTVWTAMPDLYEPNDIILHVNVINEMTDPADAGV